jgi:sugar lactone lactonase YvrE
MRVRVRRPWSIAAGVLGLALAAPTAALGGTVLVAGDGDWGQITAIATAPDGTPVPRVPLVTAQFRRASTQEVWAAPDGRHAWVSGGPGYPMRRIDVGSGGRLSVTGDGYATPPGAALEGAQAYSPDGRFAFTSNWDDSSVTALRLGDDGVATRINSVRRSTPAAMVVSPDGRFLFVSQSRGVGDQRLTTFAIGADGRLSDTGHELRGRSAERLAISADGRFLYGVAGYEDLNAYAIAPDGSVRDLASPSAGTHGSADDLALSPDGRFLYTASSLGVFTFRLGADGVPVFVGRADELTANADNSMAISPDGRSLYFTDWSSRRLFSYALGSDGLPSKRRPAVDTGIGTTASLGAVTVVPDQAPVAAFRAAAAPAGAPTTFDATASTDPDGTVVRYDWDFGDGRRAENAGPTPQHVYDAPGTHTVRLTVTDAVGTSTSVLYTGRVLRNGGPSAATASDVTIPPAPPVVPPGPSLAGPLGAGPAAGTPAVVVPKAPPAGPATVSDVRLTQRYLRLGLSGPATLRVELARRLASGGARRGASPRYRRVATVRLTQRAGGAVVRRLPRMIGRGTYRVRITLAAAGQSPRVLTMLRRAR